MIIFYSSAFNPDAPIVLRHKGSIMLSFEKGREKGNQKKYRKILKELKSINGKRK